MKEYEVHIPLKRGKQITLFLSPSKDEDIYEDKRAGGVPFQLIEGKRYYFELSDAAYYIDGDKQVITCYPSRSGVSNGTITTGNFVGTFTADIKQKDTDEKVGVFSIEIRSTILAQQIQNHNSFNKFNSLFTPLCEADEKPQFVQLVQFVVHPSLRSR